MSWQVGPTHQIRCQCQLPLAVVNLFLQHTRNPRPFPPRYDIGNGITICQRTTACRTNYGAQPGWMMLCATCEIACENVVGGWRPPAHIAVITPQLLLHCQQRLALHLHVAPMCRANSAQERANQRANNRAAHLANVQRREQRLRLQRLAIYNVLALPTGNGPNQFNTQITLLQQTVPACIILDVLRSVWSDGYMAWAKHSHLLGYLMTDAHVMYHLDQVVVNHEASQVDLAVRVLRGLFELDGPYREALGGRGNDVPAMTVDVLAHCLEQDQIIGHVVSNAPVLVAGGDNQALLNAGMITGDAVTTYNANIQAYYSSSHDQLRALRQNNRPRYDSNLVDYYTCLGHLVIDFSDPLLAGVFNHLETILIAAISGTLPAAGSADALVLEALQRGTLRAKVHGQTGCHVLLFYAACRFSSSHSAPRELRLDVVQDLLWRGEHCFNIPPLVAKAKMIILAVAADGMMKQDHMELTFHENPSLCDFLEGCFLECFGIQMNFKFDGGLLNAAGDGYGRITHRLYVRNRVALRRFYRATVVLGMDGWLPFAKRQNCLIVAAEYHQADALIPCLAAQNQAAQNP